MLFVPEQLQNYTHNTGDNNTRTLYTHAPIEIIKE